VKGRNRKKAHAGMLGPLIFMIWCLIGGGAMPINTKILRALERQRAVLQHEINAVSRAIAALTGTHQPKRDKRHKRMSAATFLNEDSGVMFCEKCGAEE
jgi:hypothetical protein